MRLRNEGPIRPAPVLQEFSENVVSELKTWSGMAVVSHWRLGDPTTVDGAELHVNDRELGHIHLNGGTHLLLTKRLRDALLKARLADPFPWGDEWVQASIDSSDDVEPALWLFRIGYDRLQSTDEDELLQRIQMKADL